MTLNPSHRGHVHFWMRPISRRAFLGSAALAGGAALSAEAWAPMIARADSDGVAKVFPRPIPGGVKPLGIFIHHFPPVPVLGPAAINEPSQITDFNGMVGVCRVTGHGTGTNLTTRVQTPYSFQVDNGFMDGLYVGEDGKHHHGTFAFV
ncbi:MAG TPA: twin-arginine translocation signal domain-containing protein [Candidatus Dormibacteraeota bacterium]|nr:twin-arginine translocation signal domain-containing protein [Candidatus Dormibacteraeota bacterium]